MRLRSTRTAVRLTAASLLRLHGGLTQREGKRDNLAEWQSWRVANRQRTVTSRAQSLPAERCIPAALMNATEKRKRWLAERHC